MVLGPSMATLLQVSDTTEFIHCVAQLLEEYDYFFSNAAYQGMVMMGNAMSGSENSDAVLGGAVKPRVRRHMRHLETRMVNFTLDPRQVVTALCDIMACTFRRFMDPVCAEKAGLFDAILKLDQIFSDVFIGHLGDRISHAASGVLQKDLGSVRGLFNVLASEGKPAPAVYGAAHGPNDHV